MKRKGITTAFMICLSVLISGCSASSTSVDDKVLRTLDRLDRQEEYSMNVEWERNMRPDWSEGADRESVSVWKEGHTVYEVHAFYQEDALQDVKLMRSTIEQTVVVDVIPDGQAMKIGSVKRTEPIKRAFLHPLLDLLIFPLDENEDGELMIPSMFRRDDFNTEFRLVLTELTRFAQAYTDDYGRRYFDAEDPGIVWSPYHMIYDFKTEKGNLVSIKIDEESAGMSGPYEFMTLQHGIVTFPAFELDDPEKEQIEQLFDQDLKEGEKLE